MARFDIERVDPSDPHKREKWEFEMGQQTGLRLTMYAVQTRQSNRHKWKGKFWDCMDERSYHSSLPRPKKIPNEVVSEAKAKLAEYVVSLPVYIGWYSDAHILEDAE